MKEGIDKENQSSEIIRIGASEVCTALVHEWLARTGKNGWSVFARKVRRRSSSNGSVDRHGNIQGEIEKFNHYFCNRRE